MLLKILGCSGIRERREPERRWGAPLGGHRAHRGGGRWPPCWVRVAVVRVTMGGPSRRASIPSGGFGGCHARSGRWWVAPLGRLRSRQGGLVAELLGECDGGGPAGWHRAHRGCSVAELPGECDGGGPARAALSPLGGFGSCPARSG